MSAHKKPLTDLERTGLIAHGLERYIEKPSQLADVFRQGIAWAQMPQEDRDRSLEYRQELDSFLRKGAKHDGNR